MQDAKYGHDIADHADRDRHSPLKTNNAQSRPDVVARHTAQENVARARHVASTRPVYARVTAPPPPTAT